VAAENLAPKRQGDSTTNLSRDGRKPSPKKAKRFDDKLEPWRPKTWPQKGKAMTNLSRGGRKPGPKKAKRFDDKVEPWRLLARPQKDKENTHTTQVC
jgi:hypothetical protein